MTSTCIIIVSILFGYFLGSIPFAILVGRHYGVDPLTQGSKNPGATNVRRLAGASAGFWVFFFDTLKGILAAAFPLVFLYFLGIDVVFFQILGFLGAVGGHMFSVFLKFKGGKGVATSMGGLCVLMPIPLMIGLVIWLSIFYLTRYVSIASLAFGISLPISVYYFELSPFLFYLACICACGLFVTHRSNIKRLLRGEEFKSN